VDIRDQAGIARLAPRVTSAAANLLAGGDAAHAAGDHLAAIDQYILAFKQLTHI
jgi:hypothetical protein